MDAENPRKIDLRKSEIFKEWEQLNEQTNSDILTLAIRETIEGNDNQVEHVQTDRSEAENSDSENEQTDQGDVEHDQTNQSEAENSDSENEQTDQGDVEHTQTDQNEANNNRCEAVVTENIWDLDEGLLAARQVDQIVNQMALDDELRALLESEPEDDEGIELNIHDELGIDIEPFDYRLEVELGDW